jgi:iron complex transport system substrate-binding protein
LCWRIADLAPRDYTVLIHSADSLADIFNSALILGRLAGKDAEARALVAEKKAQPDSLKTELKNKPLNLKGAFRYSAQPMIPAEYILSQNPDFLFGAMAISKPEDILAADSVTRHTRAGSETNISIVPSSLLLRTSPRIAESRLELYGEIKKYAEPGA